MNSEAAKLLKEGLENGDIDPNETPKSVHESRPIFEQYELNNSSWPITKSNVIWVYTYKNKFE